MEGIGQAVRRNVPFFGKLRCGLQSSGVIADQSFVDIPKHQEFVDGIRDVRIQSARIAFDKGDVKGAAIILGEGRRRDSRHDKGEYQYGQNEEYNTTLHDFPPTNHEINESY